MYDELAVQDRAISSYIRSGQGAHRFPAPDRRGRRRGTLEDRRSASTGEGPSAVLVIIPKVLRVFLADGMYTELTAPGVPILCTFIVRPITRYWNRPSPR